MASRNATTNGVNGHRTAKRFAEVPKSVFVTVAGDDGGDALDVELPLDEDIQDDPTELCTLLENEQAAKSMWMVVAMGYAKHNKIDIAIQVLTSGLSALGRGSADDRLSILNALCWMYLLKCREAPRNKTGKTDLVITLLKMLILPRGRRLRCLDKRQLHTSRDSGLERCLENQPCLLSTLPCTRCPISPQSIAHRTVEDGCPDE